MWLLKSPLDQNPIVIYQKFNGNFKSHIDFGGQKEDKKMMCSITLNVPLNFLFERQVEALNIT